MKFAQQAEPASRKQKVLKALKNAVEDVRYYFLDGLLVVSLAALAGVHAASFYGGTDEKSARKTLDDLHLEVKEYKGKASFRDCPGYYRDKFSVSAGKDKTSDVVVCGPMVGSDRVVRPALKAQ